MTPITALDRILEPFRALVQAELRALLGFPAIYEYSIAATDGTTVDAIPTSADAGLPPINKAPLRASTVGPLTPVVGRICHVIFLNGDLRKPACVWCQPGSGPAIARNGDATLPGYLVLSSAPATTQLNSYFPGTTIGLANALAAAAALTPPGTVTTMSGAIVAGSTHAGCE